MQRSESNSILFSNSSCDILMDISMKLRFICPAILLQKESSENLFYFIANS